MTPQIMQSFTAISKKLLTASLVRRKRLCMRHPTPGIRCSSLGYFTKILLFTAALAAHSPLHAALVISDGDIVGGHYTYDLTYTEMNDSSTFNADVFSQTHISVLQEGG